jgi:hypothetical protein
MPRAKSSSETFDALYDELTRERANEASEASTSTSLKSPNVAKDLRELVGDGEKRRGGRTRGRIRVRDRARSRRRRRCYVYSAKSSARALEWR